MVSESVEQALEMLRAKATPEELAGMARYGISTIGRLGVRVPDLRRLAKELGRDHERALQLWNSGIQEARILAAMTDDPAVLSEAQMEAWVQDFDSWDVCDQVCMNLFEHSPQAWKKVRDWSTREEEFVKRAAYALLACLAWHDKQAHDDLFIEQLPLILQGADDGRHYVKKAVSWALRNIGKRNRRLHAAALECVAGLQEMDSKVAQWIAKDALRDFASDATKRRLAVAK